MSTRSDKPAPATRCLANRCCSADSVTDRTRAPRAAARMHSSPQPVPISSTRLPGPDPRGVEQAVDLAPLSVGQLCSGGRQRVEQRAGVGQCLVEKLPEQLVGQVVVLRDVLTGLLRGC